MPNAYHLTIAKFKFKNDDEVEAASDLLHRLAVNSMLRHAATAAATASKNNQTTTILAGDSQDPDGLRGRVPPLCVSLIGLAWRTHLPAGEALGAPYSVTIESSNRLQLLSS